MFENDGMRNAILSNFRDFILYDHTVLYLQKKCKLRLTVHEF